MLVPVCLWVSQQSGISCHPTWRHSSLLPQSHSCDRHQEWGVGALRNLQGWLVPQWQAEVRLVKKCCPQDSESNPTAKTRQLEQPIRSGWVMISLAVDLMSDLIMEFNCVSSSFSSLVLQPLFARNGKDLSSCDIIIDLYLYIFFFGSLIYM